jgi:Ser/Thr protein kinase RdoA (MazF antagonist)
MDRRKLARDVRARTILLPARVRTFRKRREEGCTPEAVECDHALVRTLVERGFPTPPLLPARDGTTSVAWQGQLYEA